MYTLISLCHMTTFGLCLPSPMMNCVHSVGPFSKSLNTITFQRHLSIEPFN